MQILHVNHYRNHPVWNTIICVVFHMRNINSVCLLLPMVPDEKLHSIFFLCVIIKSIGFHNCSEIGNLNILREVGLKDRKTILSNCNFLLDCTTIFYKLSSTVDSTGIHPGWILLEKHLHPSLKDLTSARFSLPLLCLPRKLIRVYPSLNSWMGKAQQVVAFQQLHLKSPFTEVYILCFLY